MNHPTETTTPKAPTHASRAFTTEERLFADYLDHLTVQGKCQSGAKTTLPVFFDYTERHGLAVTRLRIPEAQDFQMHLLTAARTDGTPSGTPRYGKVTVARMVADVAGFFNYLLSRNAIHANPFHEITRLKTPKTLPKQIPTEEETADFLKHLREFWKAKTLTERKRLYRAHVVCEVLYATGARISEIMHVTLADVDLVRNVITIRDTKSGQVRECFLNEYTAAVLRLFIEEMRESVLFLQNNADAEKLFGAGKHLKGWMSMILARESRARGGVPVGCHKFRHALATHLLRAGCDIRYIKEFLGHRQMMSTQVYTHVDHRDLARVLDEYHPRVLTHA